MLRSIKRLLSAAAVFVICLLVFVSGVLHPLDNIFADMLYQRPRIINNDIKIIAIDEKTLEALGSFGNWDRQVYANLINAISKENLKPAIIGFDIMFIGDISTEGDLAFAKSAKEHGNVCLASNLVLGDELVVAESGAYVDNLSAIMLEEPYASLNEVAAHGYANMAAEQEGIVRNTMLSANYGEQRLYSFATMCYMVYAQKIGIEPVFPQTDEYSRWWIPYAGYPGDFEAISLIDVLDGKIDPLLFKDAIVLVGAYAPGLQDAYNVPIDKAEQMYGVEIHANIIQAILDGVSALPADFIASMVVFALCAALLYLAFCKIKKALLRLLLLLMAVAANIFIAMLLFKSGIMINLVYFPLAAVVVYVAALVSSYLHERAQRKKVVNAFKKYVAPQVVEELVRKGKYEVSLGGENRDIAVMFVDIRGFTPMSERLKPEEVVEILNRYLNLTTQAIFEHGGTLDKFIGDATMAIFNAPFAIENYELCAAKAALDIVSQAVELELEIQKRFGESVGFGIGLNCGEAVVGNIGCVNRMDYTAIGDTVNTAARLESNAKRSQILMSEQFYLKVKDSVIAEELGSIALKGKAGEVKIYGLLKLIKN